MIYKEMKPFLPTKITQDNLHKKTLRTRKHLIIFGKNGVGINKIKLNNQNDVTLKTNQTNASTKSEVSVFTTPIPLTHVSNSSGLVNTPVIPYDFCALYINVALKEYPHLSLFNSDRHNDGYEFKNSGLYPGCEKEHNNGKINAPPEMISSVTPQASKINPAYDRSYFRNKILDQYPNLYRECSCENFDYYEITDETSCGDYICLLCKLGHDDEEIEDWHVKLSGLPSILTDKIRSKLYKRYKKQTGNEPWQLTEVHESEVINSKPEKGPITFEIRNWWPGEDLSSSSSFKPFKPSHEASIGAQGDKTDSKLAKNWELNREPRDLPSSINIHNTFSGNIQKIGKINDRMFNTEYQENQEGKRSSRRPKRNRVCYKESSTNSSNSDDSDYEVKKKIHKIHK
ncbi:hypothetical protein RclHR1_00520003 [Rhizophagus clarus]|uniref:Uncharacterized protein n=1 Tax=Rhizophagus clarus TaxID=94130 RepID=A0A2Z6RMT6_9GLOM|nr:hypothetical protein RclHR1_00520003 [Rhizophagus clarus]